MQHSPFTNKTVLFVEQDQGLAGLITTRLVKAGARARWYPTVQAGLANIDTQKPDIILIDIATARSIDIQKVQDYICHKNDAQTPIVIIANTHEEAFTCLTANTKSVVHVIQKTGNIDTILPALEQAITSIDSHTATDATHTHDTTKVLVVEDDPFIQDMLKLKLGAPHFTSHYVTNGSEAIAQAIAFKPDIIILDLVLPGLDGFEVLEQFKQQDNLKDVPVVIYTNRDEVQDREQATTFGVSAFFVKIHTDISELVGHIPTRTPVGTL